MWGQKPSHPLLLLHKHPVTPGRAGLGCRGPLSSSELGEALQAPSVPGPKRASAKTFLFYLMGIRPDSGASQFLESDYAALERE